MKQEQRTRKVTVRFTQKEYGQIMFKYKRTTCNQLSQYIRNLVMGKPLVIKVRNTSLDAVIEEISLVREELNAIGNNYNQAVKKLHILKQIPEFRQWIVNNEKVHQQFLQQTNKIHQRMDELAGKWLQE
jgi:hypothetical protein